MASSDTSRLQYIDRLKGLAILLVVIAHFVIFSLSEKSSFIANVIVSFHMPLFLFLSGFVISSRPSLRKFLIKAAQFLLTMIIFGALFSLFYLPHESIRRSLEFLFNGSKNGYWYFLTLTISLFTLMVCRIVNHSGRILVDVTIMSLFWLLFAIIWHTSKPLSELLSMEHAVLFYPFFVIGYTARQLDAKEILKRNNFIITAAILLYVGLLSIRFEEGWKTLESICEHLIVPLSAIIVLFALFLRRDTKASFLENQLEFLGKNTLGIYILHYFLLCQINLDFLSDIIGNGKNSFFQAVIFTLCAVLVSYTCVLLSKIIQTSNFFSRIFWGNTHTNGNIDKSLSKSETGFVQEGTI